MTCRNLAALLISCMLALTGAASAQSVDKPADTPVTAAEGGQTLQDILARQAGQSDPRAPRDPDTAMQHGEGIGSVLGTRGGPSDAAVWDSLRFGTADVTVSAGGPTARVLVQDGGMWWYEFRAGPLMKWGGYALLGMIGLMAVFYLLRGRIRISGGPSGTTILRFNALERFGHWLLAGSFLLLGFTGLISLFGRKGLIPFIGHEAYAMLAQVSKMIHDNVSWAFIVGLIMVFLFWVVHNLPSRTDITWFLKGGGLIGSGHPPAKKFNAGQKIVFWSVILLGSSIAVSGLSMLFPFQMPMFATTFAHLNDWGITALVGLDPLPAQMSPQEEMQYAQLWHSMVAFVLMAIIIAHIYIGTLGMEGAFDAMGTGEVDLNWAKEHHSLWVEEVEAKQAGTGASAKSAPAE